MSFKETSIELCTTVTPVRAASIAICGALVVGSLVLGIERFGQGDVAHGIEGLVAASLASYVPVGSFRRCAQALRIRNYG